MAGSGTRAFRRAARSLHQHRRPERRDPPCLVTFHAHPDDEAVFTGGTIAKAVRAGWRVVLVLATAGELGSTPAWVDGTLAQRRRNEARASAAALGIDRIEFLGYHDSGHLEGVGFGRGTPGHRLSAEPLVDASLSEASRRLQAILVEEDASALTSYDSGGVYGHVDHIRVHQIARSALTGTTCDLYESTLSRPALRELHQRLVERGLAPDVWPEDTIGAMGVDETTGLLAVDATEFSDVKQAALAAHASQVLEASEFMGLAPGVFHHVLETEWFLPVRIVDGRFLGIASPFPAGGPMLGAVAGALGHLFAKHL